MFVQVQFTNLYNCITRCREYPGGVFCSECLGHKCQTQIQAETQARAQAQADAQTPIQLKEHVKYTKQLELVSKRNAAVRSPGKMPGKCRESAEYVCGAKSREKFGEMMTFRGRISVCGNFPVENQAGPRGCNCNGNGNSDSDGDSTPGNGGIFQRQQ